MSTPDDFKCRPIVRSPSGTPAIHTAKHARAQTPAALKYHHRTPPSSSRARRVHPPLPRVNFYRERAVSDNAFKRAQASSCNRRTKKRTFLEYNATTPRINRAANRSAYERIKEHPPILSRAAARQRRGTSSSAPSRSKTQNRSSRTSGAGGSMIVRHVSLIEIVCVLFLVIRSTLSG